MVIDAATLRDLDVLEAASPRGTSLWSLLDRTRSRAGREALRRQLVAPDHRQSAIVDRQAAHRAVGRALARTGSLLDAALGDRVERYLGATWQLPSAHPPLASFRLWRPDWFTDYLRAVEDGQTSIAGLLAAAAALPDTLAGSGSRCLDDVLERLTSALASPAIVRLRAQATGRGTAARLSFDAQAREAGKPMLRTLLDALGEIDAMWSLAAGTAERGWIYPTPADALSFTGLRHPLLDASRGIASDLRLETATRVCVVTGPNMAGKSTFLRAVALAVLLAHAGCGVPAEAMSFPAVATIFSSVQIADDLAAGESFYLAEVRRIRALAVALHEHRSMLAVLDEPFRGTNVHDAAEASLGVITRLVAHPSALVFVATHVSDVAEALRRDPRVRFLHFAADMTGERPVFDYALRDGVSTQRLGMTLLRQEQVLDLLAPGPDGAP